MQKEAKMEFDSSYKECMGSYSKATAKCITEAKNRNQMLSGR